MLLLYVSQDFRCNVVDNDKTIANDTEVVHIYSRMKKNFEIEEKQANNLEIYSIAKLLAKKKGHDLETKQQNQRKK